MDMSDIGALGERQRVFRARYKLNEPGLISHITQRAAGREPLFVEDNDYLTFIALLKDVAQKMSLTFHAFCLMPNHAHLLLQPAEKNLSEAMHSIFSRYAMRFNRKYQRRGHLFGGPFRQAVCLDNTYLLTASVYIHLNPVRAGLAAQAAAYRWSSCSLYCREEAQSFVDTEPVLSLIHHQKDIAKGRYAELVDQGGDHQPENALEQEGAIEAFCSKLSKMFPRLYEKVARKNRSQEEKAEGVLELTDLENLLQEYQHGAHSGPESREARKYLVEQLLARGFKKTQVAERLSVSRQTIYNILNSP